MLHHGIEKLGLVWKVIELDPQQRQHFIMFNLLFIAGVIELLLSLKKIQNKLWQFIWPGVIIVVGFMFLFHPQHGTAQAMAYSVPYHHILGTILLLTGGFRTLNAIFKRNKFFSYAWLVFLLITSIMLIIYNEPEGVYQIDSMGHN